MKILVLGGTYEARLLANRLVEQGHDVTTSLAGRTSDPVLPEGKIRVGKFGGVPGLRAYLKRYAADYLVDATHPYAGLISINAVAASQAEAVPLLRFMRAPWAEPEGANWRHAESLETAAKCLPVNAVVLLTTGHEGLETFLKRDDCRFVIRLIEPPDFALPRHAQLVLDRPPYTLEGEMALMRTHRITHLVTKNSGGSQTSAKLEAARRASVEVVMIRRPAFGPAHDVSTLEEALAALHEAP
jgi:precorrin-6A/cobalt-precorrin-6A reductase